jgi:predicted dehydrogenase
MNNSHAHFGAVPRRQFLVHCAAATSALALPQLVPSGLLAAPGRLGPNEQVAVGFIGMGRQAGDLLKGLLRTPEGRVVAVADVNLTRAQAVAEQQQAAAYQDYRRLLERKDVDAIITATPEHWRGPICIHALQAGKDVYAEKPVSLTIREGRLFVEATRKYRRVFQTGSQQRSMIRNRVGCEFIRSGKLGKITRVIAHNYPSPWEGRLPAQPIPDGLDWEFWCGPAEPVPYHQDLYLPRANPGWLSFRPYSGGEMTGWGAHGFDQVQWALGMDEAGPVELWVEGPKFGPPTYTAPESRDRGNKLCSQPKVFFRYPGDIIMELGDGPAGGALFLGEKGEVRIDRGVFESDPDDLIVEALRNRPQGVNENHIQNWIDCIKTRAKPVADIEMGHRSATVCHLGNIARQLGRRLHWDPAKEVFPGDAEANSYLDRPRRKPWELPAKV